MRAVLLALLFAASPAVANGGAIWGSSGGSSFSGGTLTAPIVLSATNTLCSQTLALAWTGDLDTGMQRSAANTLLLCAGGLPALELTNDGSGNFTADVETAATAATIRAISTGTGHGTFSASTTGGAVSLDAWGATSGGALGGVTLQSIGTLTTTTFVNGLAVITPAGPIAFWAGSTNGLTVAAAAVTHKVQSVYDGVTTDITTAGTDDLTLAAASTGAIVLNDQTKVITTTGNPFEYCVSATNCGSFGTNTRVAFTVADTNNTANVVLQNGSGDRLQLRANNTLRIGEIFTLGAAAGNNLIAYSAADAAGDISVAMGSSATATAETLLRLATDLDGTPVKKFDFNGDGHISIAGTAPSSYTSGTCTAESGTGDDTHGTVTGTCTAQTLIVTFGGTYTAAPVCVVSAMNGAASAGAATLAYTTSTTVLTLTVTTATTGGIWAFHCIE